MSSSKITIRQSQKTLKKECDKLWADCVKAKAGHKSEISGKTESLHAHHLVGKANFHMRYCLENGICLTAGEHFYVAHHAGRVEDFRSVVKALRGVHVFENLNILAHYNTKVDLWGVREYFKKELKRLAAGVSR